MRIRRPRRVSQRLTRVLDTFTRARMIDHLMDTGLFDRRKDATACLDAVAGVMRAWLIAWCTDCPPEIEARLQIPGAFSLSLAWCKFGQSCPPLPRLYIRLTPRADAALRAQAKAALCSWSAAHPDLPPHTRSRAPSPAPTP